MDLFYEIRDAAVLGAAVFACAGVLSVLEPRRRRRRGSSKKERLHARHRSAATSALVKLGEIDPLSNPARAFGYLRAVPALVFEEMILTEIEKRGHGIVRSARYTGDGGIDGYFEVGGRSWFIQAKRYRFWVRPADVVKFGEICAANGARGLFVHTGKTGPASKAAENASPYVRVVSGLDLIRLFAGEGLPLYREQAVRSGG